MALFKRTSGGGKRGFLARLGRDTTGNVFAMTAAAVVPMIGVVGGAIDASRMYMTRSRLQAACDSAVLSGRKAMTSLTFGDTEKAQARAMFNFNFQDADFGTTSTLFTPTGESSGRVNGTATTSVPMTLMKVFGFANRTVSVNCSADIQIPNIDIVFVLDVTGSMDSRVSGTRKIDALQAAMERFYDEIDDRVGAAGRDRVRYGFVPYSQTVNVRDLFTSSFNSVEGQADGEAPLDHIANTMEVESRVANFEATGGTTEYVLDDSEAPFEYTQTFSINEAASRSVFANSSNNATSLYSGPCNNYVANVDTAYPHALFFWQTTYFHPHTSYDPGNSASVLYATTRTATSATQTAPNTATYWRITFSKVSGADQGQGPCIRKVRWTKYKQQTTSLMRFKNYTYKKVTLDSSAFKAGNSIRYVTRVADNYTATGVAGTSFNMLEMAGWANQTGLTTDTTSWDGCIEERDTVATDDFSPIPGGAFDLNAALGGTTAQTRWRPIMRRLTWNRGRVADRTTTDWDEDRPDYSCPTATVRNLRVWSEADFDAYVATLDPPVGFTYLDVGMIWGLRLIHPQGIWGYRNLTGGNGGQIARHLIFLTDGQPVSEADTYSSYGVERMARRIVGGDDLDDAADRHEARFQAMCDSMRGTVTIWTIAFDTPDGDILEDCADPGRAKSASNAASLNSVFTEIANDISDLRLVR